MKSVFSEAGAQRLDEAVSGRLLCAFDFDGTLAPIVAVPDHAGLPDEVRRHLLALSQLAPLAVITGRSVDDIRGRLGFAPDFLVGNHGMEGVPGAEGESARHAALCAGWRRQLEQALNAPGSDPGIMVEDKRFSLSVHYRHARDPALARQNLVGILATLDPAPRIVDGKFVFNLVAADASHKGTALERLMTLAGASQALYVGDDVTDEDVFRLQRRDLVSIRVEQSPDSAAGFYLPHPQDILPFLEDLQRRLGAKGASNWIADAKTGPP